MKRINSLTAVLFIAIVSAMMGCGGKQEPPHRVYMPDMGYSRAVETYSLLNDTVFTDDPAKAGRV